MRRHDQVNSKERVKKTLSFCEADRIPLDYWADEIITRKLCKFLGTNNIESLYGYFNIDFRFIEGTKYIGPDLRLYEDGSQNDIWGVRRKKILLNNNDPDMGNFDYVITHPLASATTVKEIEEYKYWPSPDWFNYSEIEQMTARYHEFSVICGAGRLNRTAQLKPAMYLRGVEMIMLDLSINANIIEAITERLVSFYLEYNRRVFDRANGKIDIFFMGDDFGTQNGLIMSIEMWRKFYKNGFKKFIELAHSFGIKVMHHTCGGIAQLIPDFIDCGLDILQSLQPRALGMDLVKIKKEYGKYICLQGGIDIQQTMPYGSTEDVANEVKDRIKDLGPGGGYILCTTHNLQPDTPIENVLALYETANKYGKY
jgi:uroporphyrinogen decarboxylase